MWNRPYLIISFFISMVSVYSQEISLKGTIKDSTNTVLSYVNLIAKSSSDDNIAFSITNEYGKYSLNLKVNTSYVISVSHMGFTSKTVTITTEQKDIIQNIVLSTATTQLDEVILIERVPIVIKEDTLIYTVDTFMKGNERKLRDVLKRLPGIEIDLEGNVKVHGKIVRRVFVENKEFFTGKSKFAVNNIPGDAIDKVEVLDNYNDVTFLKDLQDSDETILNIKLKENKKNFVFGEIEGGIGNEEKYIVHPNVFYYSPKTSINFIGDINNIGVQSFTFGDYLEFQGGAKQFLEDPETFLKGLNTGFINFLNNQDFTENINRFGAFNFRQTLTSKTDVNTYIIASDSDTETNIETINIYNFNQGNTTEERSNNTDLDNFFVIGKLEFDYDPSSTENYKSISTFKYTRNETQDILNTTTPISDNFINTTSSLDDISFNQYFDYSKKFSDKYTGTITASVDYNKNRPTTNWITDQAILQNFLQLEPDARFDILQQVKSNSLNIDLLLKYYIILNSANHIYFSIGERYLDDNFSSSEIQILSDGSRNDFSDDGFENNFNYRLNNFYLGLEYKSLLGKLILKPALYFHMFNWGTRQFETKASNNKYLLLPRLKADYEISKSQKFNFKYRLRTRFPTIENMANRFILRNFNSIFMGNETLENERYHSVSLGYYRFNLFRNLTINSDLFYTRKIESIKTRTQLEGIDQLNTTILLDQPENNLSFNFSMGKKINSIKYNLKSRFSYSDFFQLVNNDVNKNISRSFSGTASIQTFFKNLPEIEIGYTTDVSDYKTSASQIEFTNNQFFANLDYLFLKNFTLKGDYRGFNYQNKSQDVNSIFEIANLSLSYHNEDSLWGFEIKGTNLFNTGFKQKNTFSNFLISDSRTFILPRILLFKVFYKL